MGRSAPTSRTAWRLALQREAGARFGVGPSTVSGGFSHSENPLCILSNSCDVQIHNGGFSVLQFTIRYCISSHIVGS